MCRWLAYSGAPIYLEELLFRPERSLIHQSLAARVTDVPTNGDGFGVGWYDERQTPGLYRDLRPAWNDSNLRELAGHIQSPLFLAHVRAATGGSLVQRANCHPFRHGRWLFMHNGRVRDFSRLRRTLAFAVAPELFPEIEGTTDTEILFYLALTLGLEDDPIGAVERMVGLVESTGREAGIEEPLQMSACVSDGCRIFAFRYSSEHRSRSLFRSRSVESLRELDPRFGELAPGTYAVVSEPLTELSDYWEEIPESTVVIVEDGEIRTQAFQPTRDEPTGP
jgi:glutamine amidotransferase